MKVAAVCRNFWHLSIAALKKLLFRHKNHENKSDGGFGHEISEFAKNISPKNGEKRSQKRNVRIKSMVLHTTYMEVFIKQYEPDNRRSRGKSLYRLIRETPYIRGTLEAHRRNLDLARTF